jgi:hypothetical protein
MRALALFPLLICLLAPAAVAGPWPRAPGSAFVSAGAGIEAAWHGRQRFAELYGEYGLGERVVLGAHLRRVQGINPPGWEVQDATRADLFLRWHPDLGATAMGLMLGARFVRAAERQVAPLLAVHLGRGVDTPLGNIWARAGLQAVRSADGVRGVAEVEFSGQVGWRSGRGLGMVTASDYRDGHGRYLKLTPAVGYAVTRRTTLVVGAALLPRSRQLDAVQISLWLGG